MPLGVYPRGEFTIEQFYELRVVRGTGDECWGWTGATLEAGYGEIRHTTAHRVSWEIHRGAIPEGMQVLHTCDNPPCTNPSHLYLGTDKDNRRDACDRCRYPGGAKSSRAILTSQQAAHIKLLAETRLSHLSREKASVELAKMFPVSRYTIRCVLAETRWRHIKSTDYNPEVRT